MLYLRKTCTEASPKALFSRRTSYLRVRLEFLPYPHLIPTLFNGCGFGPPLPFYGNFNLDMDRSPGFGSTPTDSFRPLQTWFTLRLHTFKCLTSPASVTRRTVLQKVRGSTYKVVPQLVNIWFQVLFHSPPGGPFHLSFTVLCAIGH